MNKTGPIIVIEDDADDQEILTEIFHNLGYPNKVIFFFDGNEALSFIEDEEQHPFIILSDINMPKINGFELREKMFTSAKLTSRSIPYLFFTTGATRKAVRDAYSLSVQGFFTKPDSVDALERTIKRIVEYWQECMSPNQFN